MATRTGVIHIGAGHPNDDGLIDPPGVEAWWFSEGARPIWVQGMDGPARGRRGWLPRGPGSSLYDGLVAIFLARLPGEARSRLPEGLRGPLQDRKVDFAQLGQTDSKAAVRAARARAADFGGKLVLSAFHSSALLSQFAVVEEFDVDVELLAPVGTRLWSRWRNETRTTGLLAGGAA